MINLLEGWYLICKWKIISFVVVFLIVVFIIIITSMVKNSTKNRKIENLNERLANKNTQLAQTNDSCPGPIELPCREGPMGPAGPSGGLYLERGPLRNLGQTDMVADRMFNSGVESYAYLNSQNYKPQQNWILYSSLGNITNPSNGKDIVNKLENQYGGCLKINTSDESSVYMTTPIGCKNATEWTFTAQGTLIPKNNSKRCLTYTPMGTKNGRKLLQLKMTDCDDKIPVEQQWSFN